MNILDTDRLSLRRLEASDAPFILELLNEPLWLRFIGDKNVRTLDDARGYIANGPGAMYAKHGFGLYRVALHDSDTPIGICGLIKRDTLADVDLGFAFLPQFRAQGYAREAAAAVLDYGRTSLRLKRVVAITLPDNDASTRVLQSVGLRFEQTVQIGDDPQPLMLYATQD